MADEIDKRLGSERIVRFLAEHGGKLPSPPAAEPCLACGATQGVDWHSSRTAYHWDGNGKDPNAPVPLCEACAKEHHEYWDEMWDHVYG